MQFVFGYGSLAADLAGSHPALLRGRRRGWGVAMDNAVDVPGYKHYRLRADGSRPEVFVAFLDLFDDPAAATHGVCVAVDDAQLAAIDHRERNYERVDVTDAVMPARGTVWAYVGSAERARPAGPRPRGRDRRDQPRLPRAHAGNVRRARRRRPRRLRGQRRGRRPAGARSRAVRELTAAP